MTTLDVCGGRFSIIHLHYQSFDHTRWASRNVVDLGYGIEIGNDDPYLTLAHRVSEYFALGVEPLRWLVDVFPFRAHFQLPATSW